MDSCLFHYSLDAAHASRAGFFFLNLEMTNYASVFDMRTTTDFTRDRIVEVANRIDGEFLWIFVPELPVRLKCVAGVRLVVFIMHNFKICFNPFVDLVFDFLLLLRSKLAV